VNRLRRSSRQFRHDALAERTAPATGRCCQPSSTKDLNACARPLTTGISACFRCGCPRATTGCRRDALPDTFVAVWQPARRVRGHGMSAACLGIAIRRLEPAAETRDAVAYRSGRTGHRGLERPSAEEQVLRSCRIGDLGGGLWAQLSTRRDCAPACMQFVLDGRTTNEARASRHASSQRHTNLLPPNAGCGPSTRGEGSQGPNARLTFGLLYRWAAGPGRNARVTCLSSTCWASRYFRHPWRWRVMCRGQSDTGSLSSDRLDPAPAINRAAETDGCRAPVPLWWGSRHNYARLIAEAADVPGEWASALCCRPDLCAFLLCSSARPSRNVLFWPSLRSFPGPPFAHVPYDPRIEPAVGARVTTSVPTVRRCCSGPLPLSRERLPVLLGCSAGSFRIRVVLSVLLPCCGSRQRCWPFSTIPTALACRCNDAVAWISLGRGGLRLAPPGLFSRAFAVRVRVRGTSGRGVFALRVGNLRPACSGEDGRDALVGLRESASGFVRGHLGSARFRSDADA